MCLQPLTRGYTGMLQNLYNKGYNPDRCENKLNLEPYLLLNYEYDSIQKLLTLYNLCRELREGRASELNSSDVVNAYGHYKLTAPRCL